MICVIVSSLTGCLAAATAAAAAAAFIAPALGYIPASNTHTHGLKNTICKTGHSTHSTLGTQSHKIHARTQSQSHATIRCWRNYQRTSFSRERCKRTDLRGAPPAASPGTRPTLACRLPLPYIFLHSNFSSTIFMFEEYFSRIGDIRSNRYVLSGDFLRGVVGRCYGLVARCGWLARCYFGKQYCIAILSELARLILLIPNHAVM